MKVKYEIILKIKPYYPRLMRDPLRESYMSIKSIFEDIFLLIEMFYY